LLRAKAQLLQAELAVIIKLGGIGFPPGYKKTTILTEPKAQQNNKQL
jgi:hypothetical protein